MPAILKVAVDVPVRDTFDYLAPHGPLPAPGTRVRVPFGRGTRVGLVLGHAGESAVPAHRLKAALGVLDDAPLLPPSLIELLTTAARYYHCPIGETVFTAVPVLARRVRTLRAAPTHLSLTPAGQAAHGAALARAPAQAALLERLRATGALALETLRADPAAARAARALVRRGWAGTTAESVDPVSLPPGARAPDTASSSAPAPTLNADQARAVDAVVPALGGYAPFLLDGVTGSGKTEVYLQLIERVAAAGRQPLMLVPEISLTPQTVGRIEARLPGRVVVLHSGLTDRARLAAWTAAASGRAQVVLGTRSALFVPLHRPGLIVVDEEHDPSYKQAEGLRYHARDLAVLRARIEAVPVLLGSATPSLESLAQAARGRYRSLHLPARAAGHAVRIEVLDLRRSALHGPLSAPLEQAIAQTLTTGAQALVFINRRGFAPVLLCQACGQAPDCPRCDARLTVHLGRHTLLCHHCGHRQRIPARCPACGADALTTVGAGTERIEALLRARFPDHTLVRLDRDTAARAGALEAGLEAARSGRAQLLVGTQMLAKGHHFPNVALAAVLDADQGLFAADFRAPERLAQLIAQVAGRAGRADRPGRVFIQTRQPDHPVLRTLVRDGYGAVAAVLLEERTAAGLPPATHMALLRAQAPDAAAPMDFLHAAAQLLRAPDVDLLGPVPAPMARRAGLHRAQLALVCARRAALHRALDAALARIDALPGARRVQWSVDVDPADAA